MNSDRSRWNDFDPAIVESIGATHWGVARAEKVDPDSVALFDNWIAEGCCGSMDYLQRYADVRCDPRLLLDGAQSIVCCAFSYFHPDQPQPTLPIARYALGRDYHKTLRHRLTAAARQIEARYGGSTRVCVDTAPLRERYWAARSGLGFIGRNNQLIIPGVGSYFFLGFILTTTPLQPTAPLEGVDCGNCRRCIEACPTAALDANGRCNASRCLSYLTIEHRGSFSQSTDLHNTFYGCDRCASACPHNRHPEPTFIADFSPNPRILALTAADIASMTPQLFDETFAGSAMRRAGLDGMKRNIACMTKSESNSCSVSGKCVSSHKITDLWQKKNSK